MPVTIVLEQHQPKVHPPIKHAESLDKFFQGSCPYEYSQETTFRGSSFCDLAFCNGSSNGEAAGHKDLTIQKNLYPSSASFVRSAIEAWARHSHLVLRPDDIWFQILVQMNFFMTKNAESVRHLFVSHEGQQHIQIEICSNDWGVHLEQFEKELQKKVKTPWLADWVSPGFSTSTHRDKTTAIVLMMGLMKAFFTYAIDETCGNPSITLLGTKADWKRLLCKIDRLDEFGAEPSAYKQRLVPLLSRIAETFDEPGSATTKLFWDQMVHAKVKHDSICGRPPVEYVLSGWLVGFFYWKRDGSVDTTFSQATQVDCRACTHLDYDGVQYGEARLDDLPVGYATVEIESVHEGWKGWLLAGGIGKTIVDGVPDGYPGPVEMAQATTYPISKEEVDDARNGKESTGCFSSLLQSLNCFGEQRHTNRQRHNTEENVISEKHTVADLTPRTTRVERHSTIQPQSGWVVFSPRQGPNPFVDTEDYGPTVDAIESCKGVEHFRA